jgi:hypothetical protein
MRYIAVQWHQNCPDDPIEMLSEIDDAGWEQRKVEIYADGRCNYADKGGQTGSTELGLSSIPSLAEIVADPQFTPREISPEEFESSWKRAGGHRRLTRAMQRTAPPRWAVGRIG